MHWVVWVAWIVYIASGVGVVPVSIQLSHFHLVVLLLHRIIVAKLIELNIAWESVARCVNVQGVASEGERLAGVVVVVDNHDLKVIGFQGLHRDLRQVEISVHFFFDFNFIEESVTVCENSPDDLFARIRFLVNFQCGVFLIVKQGSEMERNSMIHLTFSSCFSCGSQAISRCFQLSPDSG